MRGSLLVRWLALTLAIALGSIVVTAALATYGTSERIRRDESHSRSLVETDSAILKELNRIAARHRSWDEAASAVRDLAERHDRRIALTTPSGEPLVDSQDGPMPSPAAATIDAASRLAEDTRDRLMSGSFPRWAVSRMIGSREMEEYEAGGDATGSGSTGADSTTPGNEGAEAGTEQDPPGDARWKRGRFVPLIVPSQVKGVQESGSHSVEQLAAETERCLSENRIETRDGEQGVVMFRVMSEDESGEKDRPDSGEKDRPDGEESANQRFVAVDVLESVGNACLPLRLSEPTGVEKEINSRQRRNLSECLAEEGVRTTTTLGKNGRRYVQPEQNVPNAELRGCVTRATEQALRGYVAPTAQLYLGTSERFSAFSGSGLWRTAGVAFAVLLAAAVVTVLAGRRMVRPVHALTGAAQRMASGDHGARVPEAGPNELARMGAAFNRMADSVQEEERLRRAMISDVAHELRNPLANVRGYLEAAEDGVVSLDSGLVSSLQEEARLLDRLVDDLQDLALADAGELRLHVEECDLGELVRQVAAGYQGQADAAGVALETRVAAKAPEDAPHLARVDAARMRQVIGNLVANALAYTSAGGRVVLELRGTTVLVSDTGVGIAPEHLPHVFDRFYRADSSRTRRTGGSGLGLAISRHLVEAHGGTIDVESTPGVGTTFTVSVPA